MTGGALLPARTPLPTWLTYMRLDVTELKCNKGSEARLSDCAYTLGAPCFGGTAMAVSCTRELGAAAGCGHPCCKPLPVLLARAHSCNPHPQPAHRLPSSVQPLPSRMFALPT